MIIQGETPEVTFELDGEIVQIRCQLGLICVTAKEIETAHRILSKQREIMRLQTDIAKIADGTDGIPDF